MPRGRPQTRPVRTTQKRKYNISKMFTKAKKAERKANWMALKESRAAARALLPVKQKRAYKRKGAVDAIGNMLM